MEQNECESNVEMVDVVTQIHVILVALVVLITCVSAPKSFDGGGKFVIVETTSLHVVGFKRNYPRVRWRHTFLSWVGNMVILNLFAPG